MRRGMASCLVVGLAFAVAGQAAADGPPELQALVRVGGPIGKDKDKITQIFWVDAARHGHIAFAVTTETAQEVWEFRSSTEKPYGHLVQIASSPRSLSGLDLTDDGTLAYRGGDIGCDVFRSAEGLAPKLFGRACGDPAKGDPSYSSLPGGGAYFRGTYYFKATFGKTAAESATAFVSLASGGTPALFSEDCGEQICRSVRVDPDGGVWGATQTDVYRLTGGKAQPYIHSLPAFVDDWGVAQDQILVARGDHVDTYGLSATKRRRAPGPHWLCCGVHDGNLALRDGSLVRVDRKGTAVDTTVIAKHGDPVAGSVRGSKLDEIDARFYASPAVWDGTAAFVAKLSTGRQVLILRRPQ